MNNTQVGGLRAHRANALALRLELGLPETSTGTSAITFGCVSAATLPVMEALACKAAEDRQDAVFAVYSSPSDTSPAWYFLVFRMLDGIGLVRVEPACVGAEKPLVLVTMDRSRQFDIDERGVLREVAVEKAATRRKARIRAESRIAAAVEAVGPLLESGAWEETTFAFHADGTAVPVDTAAA
ncbi:hypothetical protein [Pelagerythrobacter marensis]|uniref:Uncharacterized protein n=1 Tax=Pelagerythrobacter marensis TaxID=543877 RepID=A0A0G3XCX3_9SPHN|nr:hypothetical protein [Pelagerythrobacter marensis]AKM08454.1 hypothetical protein AM2010_2398 [Pelagerythrobacter marensis]